MQMQLLLSIVVLLYQWLGGDCLGAQGGLPECPGLVPTTGEHPFYRHALHPVSFKHAEAVDSSGNFLYRVHANPDGKFPTTHNGNQVKVGYTIPDSVANGKILESKFFSHKSTDGDPEINVKDKVMYDSFQLRAQTAMAKDLNIPHEIVISGTLHHASRLPYIRPSSQAVKGRDMYYLDTHTGDITHKWDHLTMVWVSYSV